MKAPGLLWALLVCQAVSQLAAAAGSLTELSKERLVFQTKFGDLHLAFYPNVRTTWLFRSPRPSCLACSTWHFTQTSGAAVSLN